MIICGRHNYVYLSDYYYAGSQPDKECLSCGKKFWLSKQLDQHTKDGHEKSK